MVDNFLDYILLRKLSRSVAALLIAGVLGGEAQVATAVNVPLDHWGYRLIERFEARGILRGLGDGIKPFSRVEMARALVAVAAAERKGASLTGVERQEFLLLWSEFREELAALGAEVESAGASWRDRVRGGEYPIHYRTEQGELFADLLFRQQTDLFSGRGRSKGERVFRNRVGGVVHGNFMHKVGYSMRFEQTREQGSRTYHLRDDVFERRIEVPQLKGEVVDFHEGMASLHFSLPFLEVELGKGEAAWGPAPEDNLGLSRNAPSFDMLRLRARYGAFKLVSIAGSLRPCPARGDSPLCSGTVDSQASYTVNGLPRRLERSKYLAAHRLEVELARWIDLGFQEVVVYGDRGPEIAYLNPVMFYWAAQSYLGDKDNVMMGVDVDIHPGNGIRLYLAYVVDDLKKLRIFSNDYANKFSLQTGLLWVDPFGLRDSEMRAEYVRIEPWIYTHKFPVNTFRHFDAPLGHALGPNSDRWKLSAARRFTRDLSLDLEVSRTRHGDNELLEDGSVINRGGDLHLGRRAGDEVDSKRFLAGNLGKRAAAGAKLSMRIWPFLFIEAGYESEWGSNVPLPPRWGRNVSLHKRSGYGDGRQQHFSLDLRYQYF